jgi:hypothetical protein
MSNGIITADKKFRKQVVVTLAIALPVCVGVFFAFKLYFHKVPAGSSAAGLIDRVQWIIFWISIVNGVISAWLSTRLIFISIKTFKFNQFPPPGVRVIRDTKIRTGHQARILGMMLIVAAIVVLSTNLVMYHLHQILNDLMRQLMV